jgi:hypothetical protein
MLKTYSSNNGKNDNNEAAGVGIPEKYLLLFCEILSFMLNIESLKQLKTGKIKVILYIIKLMYSVCENK